MYHYFEHWCARPGWLDLTIRERTAYLDQFASEMEGLANEGVVLLGIVLKETPFLHRVESQYRVLWAVPDGPPQVQALDAVRERHGWGLYFERRRARMEPIRMTDRSPTAPSVKASSDEERTPSVPLNGHE